QGRPWGFGGPGGMRGGRMGFELGRLIPPPMRQQLQLTDDQNKQLDQLEKEIKEKLNSILTEDQRKQLETIGNRGPGGFGGPPGSGPRRGGFGGPPGEAKTGRKDGNRPPDKLNY
ncbi:MAG TPA: hypothetical protein PKA06_16195, partial [Gemmatales bacterium]|nr:hypothetical protein [Gemmatales bacterium]